MGLTARNTGGGDFKPCPAGSHVARCCWLVDLGYQKSQFGTKHQVLIGWELPEEMIEEGDRAGEPYFISSFYTVSLHEKSKLRPHLEAWRGREFTEEEQNAFDLRNILDKSCLLSVTHKKKEDGTVRAQVTGVSALPRGLKCPERINPLRLYNQDQPDPEVYEALPEWVQKKIEEAVPPSERLEDPEPPPPGDEEGVPADDDLPF